MGRHTTKLGESSRAETRPPLPYPVRDGRVPPTVQAAAERRSHRRRSRLAALSAASMLAIGGAAGVTMAMADEPEASGGDEIVFSGDCGTLGIVAPTSRPDTSEVTVTEGSQVRYTNALGTSAELHVGTETYDIGAGSTQVFVMNQSAEIAMVPDCRGLFAQYDSAQVNVVDPPKSEEQDNAGEEGSATGELPSQGSGDDSDDSDDSGNSDSTSGQSGDGGDAPSGEDTAGQGEDAAVEGDDGATDAEAAEGDGGQAEEEDVNSFGAGGTDDADFTATGDEVVAVDPKAVSDGASGLLAMVAIVCLVGVSAAVMRTILRLRATA